MSLDRKALLQAKHGLRIERVSTPEWGGDGHVYLRELSAAQAAEVRRTMDEKTEPDDIVRGAKMLVLCLCDKRGEPVLQDGDHAALMEGSMAALNRCAEAVLALNGLLDEDEKDTAKNSPRGQADDSPST